MKTKHIILVALAAIATFASGCSATLGVHSHPVPIYRERIIVPVHPPHHHHGHHHFPRHYRHH